MMTGLELVKVCDAFLEALGDDTTNPALFNVLADRAEVKGYQLTAEQRGIRGTYLSFQSGVLAGIQ